LFGLCADMTRIMKIAKDIDVPIVEDAACALGSKCPEGVAGSLGDASCFSFHPRKCVTTGEGGVVTTNNKDIADKVHAYRDFGFSVTNIERHNSGATIMPSVKVLGYNYRMCLPAGTKVLVSEKKKWKNQVGTGKSEKITPKAIEDIRVGDNVLSFNEETGKKEIKQVNATATLIDNALIRLMFSNGNELIATSNHPLYIHNKGWVEASEVTVGDRAIQYKYYSLKWRICSLKKRGRTLEETLGQERAARIKAEHGVRIHTLRADPMSNYNTSDTFMKPETIRQAMRTRAELHKKGILYPPERRQAISVKAKEMWARPNYRLHDSEVMNRGKQLRSYGVRKPTQIEVALINLLREKLPDTYKYVGDGKFWIENMNPDFINVNGYKKAIEIFTTYWKKRCYGSVDAYKEERSRLLREYGWDVLFLEVKRTHIGNPEEIIKKIVDFTYNPDIETVTVIAKEKVEGSHKVYNLGVQDNNNFYAYGILVHNTDIQAAVGVEQMKKLWWILDGKRRVAAIYDRELGNLDWLRVPVVPERYVHNYQSYAVLVGGKEYIPNVDYIHKWGEIRDRLMAYLKERGIATRQGTHAVHMLDYYGKKYHIEPTSLINTYAADKMVITIPLYPQMTELEQEYVIGSIKKFQL